MDRYINYLLTCKFVTYYCRHYNCKIGTNRFSKFSGGRIYQLVDEIFCVGERELVLWCDTRVDVHNANFVFTQQLLQKRNVMMAWCVVFSGHI